MKGVVFNLLEELIHRDRGEAAWDEMLRVANVDGAYTSLGSYPDAELLRLISVLGTETERSPDEVLRWFGRQAMPLLAFRYPDFFSTQTSARSFLLTLNSIIHPEVRKLYTGADVPVFDFDTSSADVLGLGYRSARRLCALAHGFIEGAADHYKETVLVEQERCMLRGDPKCTFQLRFLPNKA
jgi:hypothetical protein